MKKNKYTVTEEVLVTENNNTDAVLDATVERLNNDDMLDGDEDLIKLREEGILIKTKNHDSWRTPTQSKDYVDLVSQTRELAASQMFDEQDMVRLEHDSKERLQKIEALEDEYNRLNAAPLTSVDAFDSYDLVLNKSSWNYQEIGNRNTAFQIGDLALQVQLYLYDGRMVDVEKIEQYIKDFINTVAANMLEAHSVLLLPTLIFDTVRFQGSKVLPITVANPKLMSPVNMIHWDRLIEGGERLQIIDTFIKIVDNALDNGHEVEFFEGTYVVRNIQGIHSLYMSEEAAKRFNNSIGDAYVRNSANTDANI